MAAGRRILVVDDSPVACGQLAEILERDGLEVVAEPDSVTALELLRGSIFHLVVADWRMPGYDGLSLLTRVRAERLPLGVIILTGFGDTAIALEAMKAGADDFVTKPIDPERFRLLVHRVLERRALLDELEQLQRQVRLEYGFQQLVSKSAKMRKVFDLIAQVGPLASTVLVHGETGTGKELVARAIHEVSPRMGGPWVAMNCAALQETLLESELFGHEKGAFTGADRRRQGRFEMADGGTLFLDEIGDLAPATQSKLLRVLQTGNFERVGGCETLGVDVRILAASNKRLEDEVRAGRFRSDLFYRLNVLRVDLPPLRDRREDIPLLATHFLEKFRGKSTPPVTEIDHEAMQALMDYDWPGNVRELENAIKGAVALADGTIIHREALPGTVAPAARRSAGSSLIDIDRPLLDLTNDLTQFVEREYFGQLLARYRGNIARCARHSGLSRRSVAQKLRKYGLDREEFRFRAEPSAPEETPGDTAPPVTAILADRA
jgi:DNA-binding NtrC family response regulator